MLSQLVSYAEKKGLVSQPGFRAKEVRWAIHFDARGHYLGVLELGNAEEKGNRGYTFPQCPHLSQPEILRGGTGCRHFLVDSAEVYVLYTEDPHDEKIRAKHEYFVDLLRKASGAVPELAPIAASLADDAVCSQIVADLKSQKGKKIDSITLAVEGRTPAYIVEDSIWHEWWTAFRRDLSRKPKTPSQSPENGTPANAMRCLLSGELVEPLATHPKIAGLSNVGGLAMGDVFTSFDKDAFSSFGLQQGANAAMSEDMVHAYSTALNDLIKNSSCRLLNMKIVYWYSGLAELPSEADPIYHVDLGFNDGDEDSDDEDIPNKKRPKAKQKRAQKESNESPALLRAKAFFESLHTGHYTELGRYRYYMLSLSGAAGRVMVRDWVEGQFGDLVNNIEAWFDDLRIIRRDGSGLTAPPKFKAVLGGLTRELKDITAPLEMQLWHSAIRKAPIPYNVMAQALNRAKVDIIDDKPPNHARMGLLKAYWIRNHRQKGEGYLMTECYDENRPEVEYHCGALMAVLANVQRTALGDVGAGIVQRYYAAASATPALVFGRLMKLAQYHLASMPNKRLAYWFDREIAQINARIKDYPTTLTLAEQSLFALGYYQQKAARSELKESSTEQSNINTDETNTNGVTE